MAMTLWPTIRKAAWPGGVRPNVVDYEAARAAFTWEAARRAARRPARRSGPEHRPRSGRPPRRRIRAGPGGAALAPPRRHDDRRATYGELDGRRPTASPTRCERLGVGQGDRVFTLLGRVPELYVAVLGTLKNTQRRLPAVLGVRARTDPPAARSRGDGRVLVTTPALYRRKVAPIRHRLPQLEHVLLVGAT